MGKQNGKSFKPEGVVSPIGFDDGLFCVSQSKQRPINVDDSVDLIDDRLHVANHGAGGDELMARLKATGDDAVLSRASANAICDDLHIWYKVTNAVYGSGFGNLPKREELRRDDASVKKELFSEVFSESGDGLHVNSAFLDKFQKDIDLYNTRADELLNSGYVQVLAITPYISKEAAISAIKSDIYGNMATNDCIIQEGYTDLVECGGYYGYNICPGETNWSLESSYFSVIEDGKPVQIDRNDIFNDIDYEHYCNRVNGSVEADQQATIDELRKSLMWDITKQPTGPIPLDGNSITDVAEDFYGKD